MFDLITGHKNSWRKQTSVLAKVPKYFQVSSQTLHNISMCTLVTLKFQNNITCIYERKHT